MEIQALGLNCDIHIFDPTFGDVGVTRGPGWTYHHVGLRASDNRSDPTAPYLTLQTIMRENHHTFLDVLKIDIEGGELGVPWHLEKQNLNQPCMHGLQMCQIRARKNASSSSSSLRNFFQLQTHSLTPPLPPPHSGCTPACAGWLAVSRAVPRL